MFVPRHDEFKDISWRGAGGPSNGIAVIPLSAGIRLLGFLIIGTNPRLHDDQNSQFSQDLGRVVSGVMAAAVSVTQSRQRQERLERDLASSDMKIRHLVQHAWVGMFHLLLDGTTMWANNQYHKVVGEIPAEGQNDFSFFGKILADDLIAAEEAWVSIPI